LGFLDLNPANSEMKDPEVEALVSRHEEARERKDYTEADLIREELRKKNVMLEDTAGSALYWIENRPLKAE
jgi:cysteinyl-tRNA synthetase